MDIGIPEDNMVRLGGKSTDRTQSLSLHAQRSSLASKFTRSDWIDIESIQEDIWQHHQSLTAAAGRYQKYNPSHHDVMQFLEFDDVDGDYFSAFELPTPAPGQVLRGENGKPLNKTYLMEQWVNGRNAGVMKDHEMVRSSPEIWSMKFAERRAKFKAWKEGILKDQVQNIQEAAQKYDICQSELEAKYEEKDGKVLASKKIIGCTTTAAAKYRDHIKAASPDVLLVEEAGEILESHVLTALAPSVKQLILIGDHKYVVLATQLDVLTGFVDNFAQRLTTTNSQ